MIYFKHIIQQYTSEYIIILYNHFPAAPVGKKRCVITNHLYFLFTYLAIRPVAILIKVLCIFNEHCSIIT